MIKVHFRTYSPGDEVELSNMIFALYREDPEGEPMTIDKITRTLSYLEKYPQCGRVVVFDMEGSVVGYSILIYYWSNEFGGNLISIDELFVKPEWRGNGISTAFFENLFDHYEEKGVGFQLEVTPSNKKVMQYYHRLGFSEGVNRHFLKLPEKG